jgi:hypothetical protein
MKLRTRGPRSYTRCQEAAVVSSFASIHLNPGQAQAALDIPEELNMVKARAGWLPAAALSLCALAHAAEPVPASRQVAPPHRIPDVIPGVMVETLQPAGEPVNTASMPRAVRRAVVADAAKRFKVAESAVVLARAEQLTWSDASLGCPEPGMVYLQELVAGFRVDAITSAGALTYHTDARGNVVSCGARSSRVVRPPDR